MKKNLYYLFAIFCSMSLFTACSSDDDNGNTQNAEESVAAVEGVYGGTMDITMGGGSLVEDLPKDIIVSADTDRSKAKVTLNDFSFPFQGNPMSFGDIVVDGSVVVKSGNDYLITAEKTILLDQIGPCDVKVNGTFRGSQLEMTIEVSAAGGLIRPTVTFTGVK